MIASREKEVLVAYYKAKQPVCHTQMEKKVNDCRETRLICKEQSSTPTKCTCVSSDYLL